MDADGLPIVGAGIDYTKVAPIHPKKTLGLFNDFVLRTVQFLNNFSGICEEKLEDLNSRLQRMEATLCILETKLASIPGLENVEVLEKELNSEQINSHDVSVAGSEQNELAAEDTDEKQEKVENILVNAETKSVITVSQDPRYAKYLKMIHVGVLPEALRPKLIAEGLNPDLLQTPDAPVPDAASEHSNSMDSESDNQGNESYSDFSD